MKLESQSKRLDAITPMEKHENRQYSTLISLESAHTSYDLTVSNELRAVVTKSVLDNIDQWPGVKRVELVDSSADLPWEKLHGCCPNLKYVKLHLLDSDEEHHKHPVIEFLQSFTGLKRLELWVKTAKPIPSVDLFATMHTHRHSLEDIGLYTLPILERDPSTYQPSMLSITGYESQIQALLLLVQYSMLDPAHFDSWQLIGFTTLLSSPIGQT
jgi:hypothetical protein